MVWQDSSLWHDFILTYFAQISFYLPLFYTLFHTLVHEKLSSHQSTAVSVLHKSTMMQMHYCSFTVCIVNGFRAQLWEALYLQAINAPPFCHANTMLSSFFR